MSASASTRRVVTHRFSLAKYSEGRTKSTPSDGRPSDQVTWQHYSRPSLECVLDMQSCETTAPQGHKMMNAHEKMILTVEWRIQDDVPAFSQQLPSQGAYSAPLGSQREEKCMLLEKLDFAEYMQSSATIASSSLPQSETDPSLKRSQMPLKAVYQGSVVGVRYRCPAHPSFSPEHTFYRRFQLMFKSEAEAQRFVDLIENVCPIGPAAKSTRNAKGKGQGAAVGTFEAKVDPNACKPASKLPAAQPTLRASCVRAPDPFEDTHPRPQPSKLPLAVSALLALSSASNGSVAQGTVAISNALSSHGALLAGEQAHTCEQQTATGPPAEPSPPSASAVRNSSPAARRQQHTEGSMKGVQSQLIDAKSTTKAHFLTQADSLEAPPTAKKRKCAPKKKASVGVQTDLSSVEMELMLIPADGAHAHIEEAAPCTVMDYIQQGDFTPFLSLPDEQLVALLQDFTDFSPTFRALCCRLQALSAR